MSLSTISAHSISAIEHSRTYHAASLTVCPRLQMCMGCIDSFLFVYLEQLGAPVLLMGVCMAVTCAIELPVFKYSVRSACISTHLSQ